MPLWLAPPKTSVIVINFMLNLHQSYQSPMSNAGAKLEKFVVKNLEGFQLILDPTGTRVGCHTGSNILVDLDINPENTGPVTGHIPDIDRQKSQKMRWCQ